ncbi:SAGA-associated factor 29 [Nannizzia gypsea CBS 118893]|uniref:SAGA-associated factor 29 n=1 Tax=Arthroderma gypseum (strain ATCC MYA-4604 / CBS 118893) TaxID=535722 RepID=E4USH0_ARTGP|nr:SAGA-associated factor 29 [Nannizzia gypsea CBS 118893]EFR00537.1 SAGA-associated factor 29 [Nannizzia gypsea CBS 118893]
MDADNLQPQAADGAPQQRVLVRLRLPSRPPQLQQQTAQTEQTEQPEETAEEIQDSQQTARPATVIDSVAQDERIRGTAGDADGIHDPAPAASAAAAATADDDGEEIVTGTATATVKAKRLSRHKKSESGSYYNARTSRSRPLTVHNLFPWEALQLQQDHSGPAVINMSRNRPRGPATRENGLAADEEVEMWNKICQDIRKAAEKNEKQRTIGLQIAALNEKIAKNGNKPTLAEIDHLDSLHRQQLKLSAEERAILQDEPADVTKNLGILIALRSASEAADPQSRSLSQVKSRKRKGDVDLASTESPAPSSSGVSSDKLNRIKGGAQRSTSVSSSHRGDTASLDNGVEGGRPSDRADHFVIGAEVVFKHNKKQQGVEGEGIQCIIKNITGEGNKRRYDVQDPEPIENGAEGAIYKTTAASLIHIPKAGSPLPQFQVGKQVLARYPDTTTFYRAEVMGLKKEVYRLKFEGEEDDKEMEVDRRYVLDIPSK